jgi:hypothetical protein
MKVTVLEKVIVQKRNLKNNKYLKNNTKERT